MRSVYRGAGGVFIFALLLFVVIAILAVLTLSRKSTAVDEQVQTSANLTAAATAIDQFAAATGRLPCPADPTKDDGLASPNNASVNCDFPQGTLPWATIGMRRDDAFDAWGWKISYRVYSNIAGSMTQANGASMVNCDTSQALTTRQPVDATKLCPAAHDTIDSDFIAGKGLTVTDFGTLYDGTKASGGAAYVLVSHGMTGMGAYGAAGVRKDMPSSNDEKNNTKDTGPFVLEAASPPDVGSADINHYDDILLYRTVADLAKKANLAARDWPDDVLAGVRFDSTTLSSILGRSVGAGDLNTPSIVFPNSTVSSLDGSSDLALAGGGNQGLGVVGGGNTSINYGEGIKIALTQKAKRFAFTLGNFGTNSFFGFPYTEQVQLQFYNSSATPFVTTVLRGCNADGGLASFTVDPGGDFDTVAITSELTTIGFIGSTFVVSEFRTCTAAGTCATTLDAPANHCSGTWP